MEDCLLNFARKFNRESLSANADPTSTNFLGDEPCKDEVRLYFDDAKTKTITDDIVEKFISITGEATCKLTSSICGCASSNQADYRGNIAETKKWQGMSGLEPSTTP